jgi:hypothetical protein
VYVFVRRDLSFPQQVVQACHAAIEAATLLSPGDDHPHLVVLGVKSELQLRNALRRLTQYGICCKPFYEDDLGNQLTSFATQPISGDSRQLFKNYQCLRDDHCLSMVMGGAA